jgi:hypothetical protein
MPHLQQSMRIKVFEMVWTLAGEILNNYFVSVIASNMLTKYKVTVTVTPNNVLILLNQCFDKIVFTPRLTIAPI